MMYRDKRQTYQLQMNYKLKIQLLNRCRKSLKKFKLTILMINIFQPSAKNIVATFDSVVTLLKIDS